MSSEALAPALSAPLAGEPDLASYDKILVAFSGGKDSEACVLDLLERGVPRSQIELWHHDIDGREGSTLMDWPCTRDYCRVIAAGLDIPLYYSWKVGGFEREMLRSSTQTAPTRFETPEGRVRQVGGGRGKFSTRRKWPQLSPNLNVRWCSAYLKIDVGAAAVRNQSRFNHARTLFVTGERGEESTARAAYPRFEKHRSDARDGSKRRHVDQWRPVLDWSEQRVWEILERWRINPHPAYRLGWGRVSCAACIFGSPNQFASLRAVNPTQLARVIGYEAQFGLTMKRDVSLPVFIDGDSGGLTATGRLRKPRRAGVPYEMDPADIRAALSETFNEPAILDVGAWRLPRGAFGESCGPT